ncbi:transposase [Nocardia sp. CA2R105]|uniref:transposase n=1 Tax=Nocardia coffeae TaxID=2873381 RepID=UPI001CA73DDE|nr:transposase [Nocardia coffeae]MBY8862420.1 transposase [Nocardia coffeae]
MISSSKGQSNPAERRPLLVRTHERPAHCRFVKPDTGYVPNQFRRRGAPPVARLPGLRSTASRSPDPEHVKATRLALRSLAQRISDSQAHADQLKQQLSKVLEQVAPNTMDLFTLGPDTAAALLISIGDNPGSLISEAAFARLRGVAPIPASSGKTTRHQLHRGGDRQANQALHTAVIVRMRYHQNTKAYAARRKHNGKTTPEILRFLKRYLAREVFRALRTDYRAMTA